MALRRIGLSAAMIALLLGAAACSGGGGGSGVGTDAPRPDSIVMGRVLASQGFEGDRCISDLQTNPMVYDTLLKIQLPDGSGVVPGLASDYSYDEQNFLYTFDIRPEARFNNGDQVTAQDVAFSFNQWMSGEVSGSYYAGIESAEAVSDTQVKVQMKQADTFLPALLTWCTSTVYPDNFGGMSKEEYFKKPISAGAFAVESATDVTGPTEDIKLVPNKYYYGWPDGKPPLKSFELKAIGDPSQRALQFKAGDLDLLDSVDSATAAQVGEAAVKRPGVNPIVGMVANMKTGPTADSNVRAAIALALNRQEIAQALNDGSQAATGALAVNVPGYADPTTPYAPTGDIDAAKALMAKSNYPDGVKISYLYISSDKSGSTAALVAQDQLKEVGIDLELQAVDGTTLNARLADKDFELAHFRASAISPTIFDPISYFQAAPYQWTGADTSVVDAAFTAGTATTDEAEQEAQARLVQDDILKQNLFIGLWNSAYGWAVQPWVEGFEPLQYGLFYADTVGTK